MNTDSTLVLPEAYADRIKPFFPSEEAFRKTRDDIYASMQSTLEELAEKRRRSEEAAQTKRYR
jgi:hypothetical protein